MEIIVVTAVIALLAAMAIPAMLRARTTAQETVAIGNLKALVGALAVYQSTYHLYPAAADWSTALYDDPEPDFGPPAFHQALDGSAVVQGYAYEYVPYGGGTTYILRASPERLGQTGTRTFWANDDGIVFHCDGDSAADIIPGAAVPVTQSPIACP